jgi:predicted aminopeptidase
MTARDTSGRRDIRRIKGIKRIPGLRLVRATCGTAIAMAVALLLGGCGPELAYLPSLAAGQWASITRAIPLDEAKISVDLNELELDRIDLIEDVRDYAGSAIHLTLSDSYTLFYDNRDGIRLTNVSASRKSRFEPKTWTFPFVGTLPYLGFFSQELVDRELARLAAQNLDVFTYEVDAYSTLNFLPNPVQATMLARDDFSLIETVIHELLHNTIWRSNDTTFNESLATFFGRAGAVDYLRDRFPETPGLVEFVQRRYEDTDRYNAFIFQLFDELNEYYASSERSDAETVAGRESIFESARTRFADEILPLMNEPERYTWVSSLPSNNAWMLGNFRYNLDLDLFEQVHLQTQGDWSVSIDMFATAAAEEDPKAYLRSWLASPTSSDAMPKVVPFDRRHSAVDIRRPCVVESGQTATASH